MHRLSIGDVRETILATLSGRYVGPGGPDLLDLEIVAVGNGRHRLRGLRGHRTAGRFDASPIAFPWLSWLSEDSIFVEVQSTPVRFGGKRYWFRCPRSGCGRRCCVLYREQATNARAFTCRVCARMRYATQVFGRSELRLHRVARKLAKLQFTPGESIKRPKGMHLRTFERLRREIEPTLSLWQNSEPFLKHMTDFSQELDASIRRSGAIVQPYTLPKLTWQP